MDFENKNLNLSDEDDNSDINRNNYEQPIITPLYGNGKKQKVYRERLVFSLLGILLSVFVVPGIAFSLIGFIDSTAKLKKENSQTLVWAKWLGLVGVILNAVLLIVFMVAVMYIEG